MSEIEKLKELVEAAKAYLRCEIDGSGLVAVAKQFHNFDISRIVAVVELAEATDRLSATATRYVSNVLGEGGQLASDQDRYNKALAAYRAARGQQ